MASTELQGPRGLVKVAPGAGTASAFPDDMVDIGTEAFSVLRRILEDHALDLPRDMAAADPPLVEIDRLERRRMQDIHRLGRRHDRVGTIEARALARPAGTQVLKGLH